MTDDMKRGGQRSTIAMKMQAFQYENVDYGDKPKVETFNDNVEQ